MRDYENIILNLKKIKLKFDVKELYEFHYMNQVYFHYKYLFDEIGKFHKEKNGRQIMYTNEILNYWLKNFSQTKHKKTKKIFKNFIESNSHFLSIKHTDVNYI